MRASQGFVFGARESNPPPSACLAQSSQLKSCYHERLRTRKTKRSIRIAAEGANNAAKERAARLSLGLAA
jgi:hypothetical protein